MRFIQCKSSGKVSLVGVEFVMDDPYVLNYIKTIAL